MNTIDKLLRGLGLTPNEIRRLTYNAKKYEQIKQGYINRNSMYDIHYNPPSLTPELILANQVDLQRLTVLYKQANREYYKGSTVEIQDTISDEAIRLNSLMGYDFTTREEVAELTHSDFINLVKETNLLEQYVSRAREEKEMYGELYAFTQMTIGLCKERIAKILHKSTYEEVDNW